MSEIFPETVPTSLPDAVAAMGALPVPVGPLPRTLDVVEDELTGVSLSLYEAGLLAERLRLALESAQRGRSRLRAQVSDLEAQRDRRRVRLVALQNDALNMRGALSPMGEDRKVPFPLGPTLLPAVEWLIGRVAGMEAELQADSCLCSPADLPGPHQVGCPQAEVPGPSVAESADKLTRFFAPVASLRETGGA